MLSRMELPGDLVSYRLGFHAEYTTSRERMEALAKLAHKFQAPVFAHNSETEKEVRECIGRLRENADTGDGGSWPV